MIEKLIQCDPTQENVLLSDSRPSKSKIRHVTRYPASPRSKSDRLRPQLCEVQFKCDATVKSTPKEKGEGVSAAMPMCMCERECDNQKQKDRERESERERSRAL